MAKRGLAKSTINQLKKTLEQRRAELMKTAASLQAEASEALADQDRSDLFDEDPAPTADIERTLMVSDLMNDEVLEVEAALQRISAGTYGVCESCGTAIPVVRLEAIPETRYCVDCAGRIKRIPA